MEGGDQMQLLETVRSLLGLHVPVSPAMLRAPAGPSLLSPTALPEDDDPEWPTARISVAEALWGEGFLFPGGHDEALRLATPLGLTAASSLLFVGAGTGGAPRSITTELGVWVTGYECNVHLVEVANERNARSGLGRRAQVELWDPIAPKFPPHYFHHAIAVEPLHGAPMEPVLAAMAAAMKPSGQLVLVEAVADRPLDPSRMPRSPIGQDWNAARPMCRRNSVSARSSRDLASMSVLPRTFLGATCIRRWTAGPRLSARSRERVPRCTTSP